MALPILVLTFIAQTWVPAPGVYAASAAGSPTADIQTTSANHLSVRHSAAAPMLARNHCNMYAAAVCMRCHLHTAAAYMLLADLPKRTVPVIHTVGLVLVPVHTVSVCAAAGRSHAAATGAAGSGWISSRSYSRTDSRTAAERGGVRSEAH
jgi:hypothetical protein